MVESETDAKTDHHLQFSNEENRFDILQEAQDENLLDIQLPHNANTIRMYDLADIVTGRKNVSTLTDEEKYHYYKYHYQPTSTSSMFHKTVTKKNKTCTLRYQLGWLHGRSWHVYSKELEGGLCKACVLFDECSAVRGSNNKRGNFVKNAFQNIGKSEKIESHEQTEYHQKAMEKATLFINAYENPEQRVDHDEQKNTNYDRNVHILKRIIEAVLVCAQRGIALRGHRGERT